MTTGSTAVAPRQPPSSDAAGRDADAGSITGFTGKAGVYVGGGTPTVSDFDPAPNGVEYAATTRVGQEPASGEPGWVGMRLDVGIVALVLPVVASGHAASLWSSASHSSPPTPSCIVHARWPIRSQAKVPVLGSGPRNQGWGLAAPSAVSRGGDGASTVWCVRWSRWGSGTAYGHGWSMIFAADSRPFVRTELRASDSGRCYKGGPLAYTTLYGREPSRLGGPVGKWFPAYGSARGRDCWSANG